MLDFIIYINSTGNTQRVLVCISDEFEVIMSGDWYHDKIAEKIEGFFKALDYAQIKYKKSFVTLTPDLELYWALGFVDEVD